MSKRIISLIIALAMVLSLSGCGSKETENVALELEPIVVEREPEPETLQTANQATAIALKQYIHARLATEVYMSVDPSAMTMGELARMADEVLVAWENAEELSASAVDLTDRAVKVLESASIEDASDDIYAKSIFSRIKILSGNMRSTAYAAGTARKLDPQTWAENLTKQYDALKGAERYKQLASQLGTDARTAYEQMVLAQKIIQDSAALEEAEADVNAWTESINYLQGVKTASKVGVFVVGTIVTGGGTVGALSSSSMTLGTTAGVVVGGADCIVDIGATTSSIVLGENNQVTIGFNELKDKLAPVSAVVGLAGFNAAETGEQLAYIGDSLVDWFYEGKMMGVKVDDSGVTTRIFDSVGKEALKSALEAAGYVFPEEAKTIMDLVNEYKNSVDTEALKEEMGILISEMGRIETAEGVASEIPVEPVETEAPIPPATTGELNIFGEYSVVTTAEDGGTENISITLLDQGNNVVRWTSDDEDFRSMSYDPNTNTLHFEEGTWVVDVVFTNSGGTVKGSGYMSGVIWEQEFYVDLDFTKISD